MVDPPLSHFCTCVILANNPQLCERHPGSGFKNKKKGKKVFGWENGEVPPRTLDQQAEIRGHLFHNIAASWFPKAGAFAQKVQADIWAAAKAFPHKQATSL